MPSRYLPSTPRAGTGQVSPEACLASLAPAQLQSPKNREQPPNSPGDHYSLLELFMQKANFADFRDLAQASLKCVPAKFRSD